MQYNGAARPVFCVGGPPLTPWVLPKAPKRVQSSKIRLLDAFYSPQGWTAQNEPMGGCYLAVDLRWLNGMRETNNL